MSSDLALGLFLEGDFGISLNVTCSPPPPPNFLSRVEVGDGTTFKVLLGLLLGGLLTSKALSFSSSSTSRSGERTCSQ